MITANELRIGNLIFIFDRFNKRNNIERITSITNDEIGLVSHFIDLIGHKEEYEVKRKIKVEDAIPIPLTPEILEQCGFKKPFPEADYFLKGDEFFGELRIKEDAFILCDYDGGEILNKPLQYLHQLQNLYFALTGEELNIELNVQESDTTKA